MAFPDELLTDGEHVVEQFGPHWSDYVLAEVARFAVYGAVWCGVTVYFGFGDGKGINNALVGFGLVFLAVVGVSLVLGAIGRLLRWGTTKYAFTNQRVIVRQGILSRNDKTVPLDQIRGIDIHQRLLDRIVGMGHVWLNTSVHLGSGVTVLRNVHRPREVQRRLRELTLPGMESME
jgi:uncharacterized membrane protein YdbT with pleckstrin-like domain